MSVACPRCAAALPAAGARCPECGVGLAAGEELVAVFRTADAGLLPVVRSLLDAAGIDHVVQGGQASGLFPLGAFGGGPLRRWLAAIVLVPAAREEEARALLEGELADGPDDPADPS